MESWVAAGQPPELFWRLTLREISVILKGAEAVLRRRHDETAWLAWHVEALQRSKKLPKLNDLLSKQSSKPKQKRKMTPEEMISMAHLWTARTVGR